MCGRFALTATMARLRELMKLAGAPINLQPHWNIAPTQDTAVIRLEDGERRLATLRWGLVPYWAEDASGGARMINARAETVAEKAAFKGAYRARRCLVPADGFYEWEEKGADRRPFLFRRPDGEPFAFAGLWETWVPPGGGVLETFAIVSCSASGSDMARYHTRSPVALEPEDYDAWLGTALDPKYLMRPPRNGFFTATRVSTYVNKTANDDSNCFMPSTDEPPPEPEAKPAKTKKKDDRQATLF